MNQPRIHLITKLLRLLKIIKAKNKLNRSIKIQVNFI